MEMRNVKDSKYADAFPVMIFRHDPGPGPGPWSSRLTQFCSAICGGNVRR